MDPLHATELVERTRMGSVSPSNVMRGGIYARVGMDRGVAGAGRVAYKKYKCRRGEY